MKHEPAEDPVIPFRVSDRTLIAVTASRVQGMMWLLGGLITFGAAFFGYVYMRG